ncbi:hypothetical protein HAX54_029903, partial [Datura stramonium]|nr:hypothetical protein [Datura stramonium]
VPRNLPAHRLALRSGLAVHGMAQLIGMELHGAPRRATNLAHGALLGAGLVQARTEWRDAPGRVAPQPVLRTAMSRWP